jgi:hypothetical protein
MTFNLRPKKLPRTNYSAAPPLSALLFVGSKCGHCIAVDCLKRPDKGAMMELDLLLNLGAISENSLGRGIDGPVRSRRKDTGGIKWRNSTPACRSSNHNALRRLDCASTEDSSDLAPHFGPQHLQISRQSANATMDPSSCPAHGRSW